MLKILWMCKSCDFKVINFFDFLNRRKKDKSLLLDWFLKFVVNILLHFKNSSLYFHERDMTNKSVSLHPLPNTPSVYIDFKGQSVRRSITDILTVNLSMLELSFRLQISNDDFWSIRVQFKIVKNCSHSGIIAIKSSLNIMLFQRL